MIRYAFTYPFRTNHCVPVAWAHVGGLDGAGCLQLAERARSMGHLTRSGAVYAAREETTVAVYATLAGVTVKRSVRYLRVLPGFNRWDATLGGRYTPRRHYPTLTTFARSHAVGRYVVFVASHAVALIDGVIYGYYKPRSRVEGFVRVTLEAA